MIEKLRIGIVSTTHGIKGEAKVYPTTDDMNRFQEIKKVYLVKNGMEMEKKILSARASKNMMLVKFEGIDTPEEMAKYREYDIYIDRNDVPKLKENENYIGDLIDLKVKTDMGEDIGIVKDVFPTGANHVMEVKTDTKTILIPYIKECILEVHLEEGFVLVHLLDGLLDL